MTEPVWPSVLKVAAVYFVATFFILLALALLVHYLSA